MLQQRREEMQREKEEAEAEAAAAALRRAEVKEEAAQAKNPLIERIELENRQQLAEIKQPIHLLPVSPKFLVTK
jgi:hypothetical protein